ncbi:unnamed protein product [Agarophyton chilense]
MSVLPTQMGLPVCLVPSKLKYKPNAESLAEPSRIHGFQEVRARSQETVGWIKFMDPIPFLLFGRDLGASHVFVGHPSVSNQHAVSFWDRRTGYCMIQDLESESGTHVNGQVVSHLEPTILNIDDTIRFGTSAHVYVFGYLPMEYRDEEPANARPSSTDARTEASGLPPPPRRLSGGSPSRGPTPPSRSTPGSEVIGRQSLYPSRMAPPPQGTPSVGPRMSPSRDHEFSRPDDRDRGMDSRWRDRPMGRGEPMGGRRSYSPPPPPPPLPPPPNSGRYTPERGPNEPLARRDRRDDRYDDPPGMPPPPHDHRSFDRRPLPPGDYLDRPVPPPLPYPPRRPGPPDAHPDDYRDYDPQRPPMRDFDGRGGHPPPANYRGRGGQAYDYDRAQDDYNRRGGGRGGYDGDRGRQRGPRSRRSDGLLIRENSIGRPHSSRMTTQKLNLFPA